MHSQQQIPSHEISHQMWHGDVIVIHHQIYIAIHTGGKILLKQGDEEAQQRMDSSGSPLALKRREQLQSSIHKIFKEWHSVTFLCAVRTARDVSAVQCAPNFHPLVNCTLLSSGHDVFRASYSIIKISEKNS